MTVVALCASVAQVFASAAPKVKPTKIEMIKTDFASRGKPWNYQIDVQGNGEWSMPKRIKNDVYIPVILGTTKLKILVPAAQLNPVEQQITSAYTHKIAIGKYGTISPRTADEIKKMIADSKKASSASAVVGTPVPLTNPVTIKLWIPKSKLPVPFVVKSAPKATGDEYTDAKVVQEGNEIINHVGDDYYVVDLKVEKIAPGQQNTGSFIRINDKPGKRIIIRNSEATIRKNRNAAGEMVSYGDIAAIEDAIEKDSIVKMGTSENVFFVIPAPQLEPK